MTHDQQAVTICGQMKIGEKARGKKKISCLPPSPDFERQRHGLDETWCSLLAFFIITARILGLEDTLSSSHHDQVFTVSHTSNVLLLAGYRFFIMMSSIGSAVASSSRTLLRSNTRQVARTAIRSFATTRAASNTPAPAVDAKISTIVDQIEKLTLLEAADLVSHLKTRLNITEIAMPAASAAPAGAAAASGAAEEPAEEAAKPKEKSVFTLKLTGLKDPTAKAKVIREVKAANSNMNLVEAKKFVESTPQVLKEGLNKEDAEKLKTAIEAAGGTVELE